MAEERTRTKMPPDAIERDIAKTRGELDKTIDEIEEKFSTAHWKAVAKETIGDKAEIARARGRLFADKAKETSSRLWLSARSNASKAKTGFLLFLKNDPLAAAIIGYELGVLVVAVSQGLAKRSVNSKAGSKEKTISLEDIEEKVRKAALTPEQTF